MNRINRLLKGVLTNAAEAALSTAKQQMKAEFRNRFNVPRDMPTRTAIRMQAERAVGRNGASMLFALSALLSSRTDRAGDAQKLAAEAAYSAMKPVRGIEALRHASLRCISPQEAARANTRPATAPTHDAVRPSSATAATQVGRRLVNVPEQDPGGRIQKWRAADNFGSESPDATTASTAHLQHPASRRWRAPAESPQSAPSVPREKPFSASIFSDARRPSPPLTRQDEPSSAAIEHQSGARARREWYREQTDQRARLARDRDESSRSREDVESISSVGTRYLSPEREAGLASQRKSPMARPPDNPQALSDDSIVEREAHREHQGFKDRFDDDA